MIDDKSAEKGLFLDYERSIENRPDLLAHQTQWKPEVVRLPLGRLAVHVDWRIEKRLVIGDHFAFETELNCPRSHPGVDLAVDPDRSSKETFAGVGNRRLKIHHPGVTAVHDSGAAETVPILFGKRDLER